MPSPIWSTGGPATSCHVNDRRCAIVPQQIHKVLVELEFTSERARASVVTQVQVPLNNRSMTITIEQFKV